MRYSVLMMRATVEIFVEGQVRPPVGASIIVQVRDTSRQDAPATVLGEARGTVREGPGSRLGSAEVSVSATGVESTVWAHVDVDGDGRVSKGDFVTVQSYPVPPGPSPRLQVTVKRV